MVGDGRRWTTMVVVGVREECLVKNTLMHQHACRPNGWVKGLGGLSGVYIYTNLLYILKPAWCNSYIVVSL